MLCPSCRRQTAKSSEYCDACGAPVRKGAVAPLDLVLADATRVPVVETVTIGRAPGNTLQIADPSVSRVHARIVPGNGRTPRIEDAGSSHGTFVDGKRLARASTLQDGSKIRIGDAELRVERRRSDAEEGRTIMVRAGATLMVSAAGQGGLSTTATQFGLKPRVRSGYALKRLDESEGAFRWVLRDLKTNKFRRLDDTDAMLFELLDGTRSLIDLIGISEQRLGPGGSSRLARLLSDLGERGFLAGVEGLDGGEAKLGFFRRLVRPREKTFSWLGPFCERLYRRGGWLLFTRPLLVFLALLMVGGFGTFMYLLFGPGGYGTPFVVAKKIGLGGLVFLGGRFAFVAVHEVAHGLAMASFGRRTQKAGVKLVFIFPYAFVDTSEAWFEPRRNRIAISSAGPVSDLSLGGLFSILCLVAPAGNLRDIFFNLAFAGYFGAIFNLNPFLDRDGYHIMVDVLREPQLRRRAKDQLNGVLSGRGRSEDSPVLLRYGLASIGWLAVMGAFAVFMSLRYQPIMVDVVGSETTVNAVLYTLWVAVFVPVLWVVGKPLFSRLKRSRRPVEATV